MKPKYMMATTALHTMGDISSKTPDLCVISSEDQDNYIGMWVFGYGFFNVKFPKSSTRELTPEEKNEWNGQLTELSGMLRPIVIEDAENYKPMPEPPFYVHTKNSLYEFRKDPLEGFICYRSGSDTKIYSKCQIISLVVGKPMLFYSSYDQIKTSSVVSIEKRGEAEE